MTHSKSRTIFLFLLLVFLWEGAADAALLELSGPAGASVTINDKPRGFFPLEQALDLAPGNYIIECTMPGYKDYKSEIFLAEDTDWKRLHVRLTPYSKSTAVFSNILFAGLGQHYLDQSFRGYFYNAVEAGGLVTALVAESSRVNHKTDYLLLQDKYNSAINSDDVEYYRQQTEDAYSSMEDMEKLRNTSLYVAGGAIVVSMLDALFFFPSVDAGPGPGPVLRDDEDEMGFLGSSPEEYFQTVHASFKLSF